MPHNGERRGEVMTFIELVKNTAAKAGGERVDTVSDTIAAIPFETDEGGMVVFSRPCGKVMDKSVIEFSSCGLPLPENPAMRLAMLELVMEQNGKMLQAHWGIEKSEDSAKLLPYACQIAQAIDPPEVEAAVNEILAVHTEFIAAFRKRSQEKIEF